MQGKSRVMAAVAAGALTVALGAGAARFGTDHYVKAAYAFLDKYGK